MGQIGIRKEDKNLWEKRTPLIPKHLKRLKEEYGLSFAVQSQHNRCFSDLEFKEAGINVQDSIDSCSTIVAVKEIPLKKIQPHKTYLLFSHTVKGQKYNMPTLKKYLDSNCTLLDYELIKNQHGKRLVFFGRFAGLAGMIDSLHILGKQLDHRGIQNPFSKIRPAYEYRDLAQAQKSIKEISREIKASGIPPEIAPLIIGITGYGQVSKGAQEILDLLPVKEISASQLLTVRDNPSHLLYKVVFAEKDLVVPKGPNTPFDLKEYYNFPERYRSDFEKYIPLLNILVNGIYWDKKYPRILTKKYLKENIKKIDNIFWQICDISCDINGSIECTEKSTDSDEPAFVYNPKNDKITSGIKGEGIVVLAVDNLPAELPRDASTAFSDALWTFIPTIANCDKSKSFEQVAFPEEIKNAVIVYNGALTPNYKYLSNFL
jgi:alanine dehydrogenase